MSYFEPLFEADSENHIILLFVLIWAVRTPLCKISSTGEIEQRFRLN